MNTPTIQDVNDLGCCCPFPECPGNRWQHQNRDYETGSGEYKRWIRPDGADDADDLPEIYTTIEFVGAGFGGGQIRDGVSALYQGWNENPTAAGEYGEILQEATLVTGLDDFISWTSNTATGYPITSIDSSDAGAYSGVMSIQYSSSTRSAFETSFADTSETVTAAHETVTDDVYRRDEDLIRYTTTAGAPDLQGVGGSEGEFIYFCDVLVGEYFQMVLTGPFTRSEFLEDSVTSLDGVSFSGGIATDTPESVTVVTWPKVGDFPWPPLDDIDAAYAIAMDDERPGCYVTFASQQYKVGIPEEWETMNAAWVGWVAIKAAWDAADPETRGDEPVRGGKRSVFECRWDEGFFPLAWEEYQTAHGTWQSDYTDWQAADPDTRGDAPIAPTKPTDTADRPQKLETREWIYGGPEAEPFSDWFILKQAPDSGKSRPVNMKIICYHATAVGVKPTAHGEQINFDDP